MVKKIKFSISPEGEVVLSVEGAVGDECMKLTEPFENKLGIVANREMKDSFYATSTESESETVRSGD